MEAIKLLTHLKTQEQRKQYPNVPEHGMKPVKYEDKTSSGLTTCIKDFLKLSGHQAERVNTMGVPRDKRKQVTDVIGRTKTIGSIVWTKGTGTKGSADIHSEINVIINGQKIPIAVKWEVKIGKDTQSEDQEKYQSEVGNYFIVKSFDDFYKKYTEFLSKYL
jgi:hypothetical protein